MRPDTTRKGLPLGGPGAINAFRKKIKEEPATAAPPPLRTDGEDPAPEEGKEMTVAGRRRRTTRKSKKATRRRRTTRRQTRSGRWRSLKGAWHRRRRAASLSWRPGPRGRRRSARQRSQWAGAGGLITELDGGKSEQQILEEIVRVLKLKRTKAPRKPQRVILLGPPGSQTEQQAVKIAEKYKLVYVQVTQMLKDAIRREGDTPLAQDLATKLHNNEPCKF